MGIEGQRVWDFANTIVHFEALDVLLPIPGLPDLPMKPQENMGRPVSPGRDPLLSWPGDEKWA